MYPRSALGDVVAFALAMADTPEPEVPKSTGTVDESTLEPVTRDVRFVVRLVMFCVVGVIAAAFVGLRMRSAAGNCGSSLVRPGGAIIEPHDAG